MLELTASECSGFGDPKMCLNQAPVWRRSFSCLPRLSMVSVSAIDVPLGKVSLMM